MLFTLQRYEFFSKSQLYSLYSVFNVDVVYLAKVRIFQQITTVLTMAQKLSGCCLPCKGTNFLANHNMPMSRNMPSLDVVYLAKVRIFQQITTAEARCIINTMMLFTLQRYEFFSKSQHALCHFVAPSRCCLPCKGTNFLANHNGNNTSVGSSSDVVYLAKVRIFQQITTERVGFTVTSKMLFTLQRYEFFSKSQLQSQLGQNRDGCCLPCKGTNFLANHNKVTTSHPGDDDVVYLAKVRIFSKSQRLRITPQRAAGCCLPCIF